MIAYINVLTFQSDYLFAFIFQWFFIVFLKVALDAVTHPVYRVSLVQSSDLGECGRALTTFPL